MARHDPLSDWTTCVSTNVPQLSQPQATVLALWSYGIARTRSCGRNTVATFLALLLECTQAAVAQRLYAWCLDAADTAGTQRQDVAVTSCFVPLLAWIVRLWSGTQLALTCDATALSDRFVVLAVCVAYRGSAIPVAWRILPAGHKRAWRGAWLRLLRQLRPAIPTAYCVLVLADRGRWARWLCRRIVRLGWHPLLRINQTATFRPRDRAQFMGLRDFVGQVGQRWCGSGTAFAATSCQLRCTLVAWWGEGHAEPWFVLTEVPADGCDATWYGLRGWGEQSVTCTKRGGWRWQQTQMRYPRRAERRWLARAVARLWTMSLGSDVEVGPDADRADLPDRTSIFGQRPATRPRVLRLLRLG